MKSLLIAIIPLFLLIVKVRVEDEDSSRVPAPGEIIDLAQNRLFMMSTGRTMPEQKFSISDFEIFLLQLGYAPLEVVHFNFTYILPLAGRSPYWSLGTKVQVLKPDGGFKGLAVGADLGFFEELFGVESSYESRIVSLNAAVSAGGDDANVHFNVAQLLPASRSVSTSIEFPTYVQIGFDVTMTRNPHGGGMKLIAEMLSTVGRRNLSGNLVFVGIRVSGKSTVAEFGWPFGFGSGGAGASSVPLFSLTFFL